VGEFFGEGHGCEVSPGGGERARVRC
jgi:hypothetical protein